MTPRSAWRATSGILAASALAALFAFPASARAAATCPIVLQMADFRAVGSVHRTAEYVIVLRVPDDRVERTYAVTFSAGAIGAKEQTTFTMDALRLDPNPDGKGGSAAIVAILPTGGITSIAIKSVSDDLGTVTDCSDTPPFDMRSDLLGAFTSFDDGPTGAITRPITERLEGLQLLAHHKMDYPPAAFAFNEQGETDVIFTVHADGTTGDFAILKSSGYDALDQEALRVAKSLTVSPARLPEASGGGAIDVKYVVDFTFAIDQN